MTTSPSWASVKEADAVRAIIGEAGNQGEKGMTAVAEAIRNRKNLKQVFGLTAKHVDREPISTWKKARKAWQKSATTNLVKGATVWGNKEDVKIFKRQKWFDRMTLTAVIGDHFFYREAVA